jgi:putative mRNA 3-end processing factor
MKLLELTENGLYCAPGDFYVDPWRGVNYAVITHAHSDHARGGSRHYLTTDSGRGVLGERLGTDAVIEGIGYGETVTRNGVTVSLHPAGHILGSAQVRVEYRGEVWVVSGDYKVAADPTCAPFEPVGCDTFITESTFGLPIYCWRPPEEVFGEINVWWRGNQAEGRASVIFAYSLGKAQRVLAGVDSGIGPIFVHGAVEKLLPHYRAAGVGLPEVMRAGEESSRESMARSLVIAPSMAEGSPWLRKFGETSAACVSGWMQIRGARRRQALDRGFVLSDHADWIGLLDSIKATEAERVLVTHGYIDPLVRWLRESGVEAEALPARFEGEPAAENNSPPDS